MICKFNKIIIHYPGRKHIGYVSQNPVLLNATIAENIALGEERNRL